MPHVCHLWSCPSNLWRKLAFSQQPNSHSQGVKRMRTKTFPQSRASHRSHSVTTILLKSKPFSNAWCLWLPGNCLLNSSALTGQESAVAVKPAVGAVGMLANKAHPITVGCSSHLASTPGWLPWKHYKAMLNTVGMCPVVLHEDIRAHARVPL